MSKLKTRDQVNEKDTWDLSTLFESDEAHETALEEVKNKLLTIDRLKGTLANNAQAMLDGIETITSIQRQVSNIYVYAHLKKDQDTSNSQYLSLEAQALQLYALFGEVTAFLEPELNAIPEEIFLKFFEENKDLKEYEMYLNDIIRKREHILSNDQEVLLAQLGEINGGPSNTFGMLNNADLVFPTIRDEEGNEVQLTHAVYGKLLESTDRRVRRETFDKFYSVYDQFKNTIASILSNQIKINNYHAKVRNFLSARQAALFENNVDEAVYDTLLETIGKRLPLLHRYVELRKNLLEVDQLEMYDLYTPLLGESPIKMTYDEAKEITLKALAPLGEEYLSIMEAAFNERWIDLFENKGKRSGAYSSGSYDSKPYILMNWQDNLNWLYTLVHELGHSAHSYLTRKNQPYIYGSYPIFLAEIASTMNENLLTAYLLEKYQEPKVRLFILNHFLDGLKGTMFRQAQFAEFEHFMYQADADGKPLTQQFLSDHYRELNKKYYGDKVNSDSLIALEWARIPHFYYNYYVFQYATGFAAAAAFSSDVLNGKAGAVDNYLGFLKSGRRKYPIETIKDAGLDMTKSDYIDAALDLFESRLNEFEALLADQN